MPLDFSRRSAIDSSATVVPNNHRSLFQSQMVKGKEPDLGFRAGGMMLRSEEEVRSSIVLLPFSENRCYE